MRKIDVLAAILLVIGGANWGLVGGFGFNLVASLFGDASVLSRLVYALVGLAAVYQGLSWKLIQRRWQTRPQFASR
jgi:hypothetical protein